MIRRMCTRTRRPLRNPELQQIRFFVESGGSPAPINSSCPGMEHEARDEHRNYYRKHGKSSSRGVHLLAASAVIGVTSQYVDQEKGDEDDTKTDVDPTPRYSSSTKMYTYYKKFASIRYNGQAFMTARDFFNAVHNWKEDSILPEELTHEEFQRILAATPHHSAKEVGFLRNLGERAIITYPEYLFLVSLINTPKAMFLNAFKIIDTDGNLELDLSEFETLETIFTRGVSFWTTNSSIKTHFFGKNGDGRMAYEDFVNFIDGLQHECLQIEFDRMSGGSHHEISEIDFTRLLLSRTSLREGERRKYLDRVAERAGDCKTPAAVSFHQYSQYMHFLSGIRDLEVALRMYTVAKEAVSREEFRRAVRVATGHVLDDAMLDLTFKIFDDNSDGKLSHEEFIKVVKERRRTLGAVSHIASKDPWKSFVRCVDNRKKHDM